MKELVTTLIGRSKHKVLGMHWIKRRTSKIEDLNLLVSLL